MILSVRKAGYELSSTVGERQWLDGHDATDLAELLHARRTLGDQQGDLTVTADDDVAYEQLIGASRSADFLHSISRLICKPAK